MPLSAEQTVVERDAGKTQLSRRYQNPMVDSVTPTTEDEDEIVIRKR